MLHVNMLQWEGLDETSSSNEPLPPWLDAHAGPVSALDINVHTKEVRSISLRS